MTGGGPLLGKRLPHLMYGGDYNPDQWPEEVWSEDVRLMREAGVNLVSLGIFAWSRLEPKEGKFNFEWLDRIMNMLHEGGVSVDLATATASPPPWLSHAHPEMLPVLADGVRLWPGGRQHYCPSSPIYRDATRRLVDALATRYAKHPALVMWHVGNEYACHVPACYCDVSAHAFREWLKQRYGSLEELNRAWGTDFWSQRYSSWEEILPPRRTPTWPNPTQQLDFMRFSSDELLECYEIERKVLTERTPGIPVTTNFMRFFKPLDYWKWAEREDIVSDDVYQDPLDPEAGMRSAMAADLMRSLGRGRPWILMEQSPNRVNWREVNVPKAPGQMRLWSFQAVARGADGVLFFQWRQSRAGAEKFHSAMVPHGPPQSSPTWREVVRLGGELRALDAVCGSRIRADVAILLDWESWWALELPSKPSNRIQQLEQLEAYYRPFFEANVTADFARPTDDLSGYKLVVAPSLYLVSDAAAANLCAYVEGGGNLVMSFFSGVVDPNEHIRLGGYPQPFVPMLGVQVLDWVPLGDGETLPVRFSDNSEAGADLWAELLAVQGAEVLATFAATYLDGHPAVTLNHFGAGTAQYVGTQLDPSALANSLKAAWTRAGIRPVTEVPRGVEAVRRAVDDGSLLFLLNHGDASVELAVSGEPVQLSGGSVLTDGRLHLEARDVAILHEKKVSAPTKTV
ncbi:MAG TPA: beta-galactosidase [Candidatus Limnocylindria bacterium]|nr:beta-galactosidase [Candidatus Limnocylindria bacterium]